MNPFSFRLTRQTPKDPNIPGYHLLVCVCQSCRGEAIGFIFAIDHPCFLLAFFPSHLAKLLDLVPAVRLQIHLRIAVAIARVKLLSRSLAFFLQHCWGRKGTALRGSLFTSDYLSIYHHSCFQVFIH